MPPPANAAPASRFPFPRRQMFIELTDHLRCPADHDESYLVLLPAVLKERSVEFGELGCPVCHRTFPIVGGVVQFGEMAAGVVPSSRADAPPVEETALVAFLGLEGAGGYVALVGEPGRHTEALMALLPGVHLIAVNPPPQPVASPGVSLLQSARLPLKSRSMRGMVLGPGYADEASWLSDGVRAVLPGLRLAGQGGVPSRPDLEMLASASGWWVARKLR